MAEQLELDLQGRRPRTLPAPAGAVSAGAVSARAMSAGAMSSVATARARAHWLVSQLSTTLGQPVRLVITDNRHTMISARRSEGRITVRLHHMFLRADEGTVAALGQYLRRGARAAGRQLDEFIESQRAALSATRRRRTALRPAGEHHDLLDIFEALARRHFGGGVEAFITWGRRGSQSPRRKSIQLGTYVAEERLIRIHPVLDQEWVPRFYVEAVVYHEMLHHEMPCVVKNGRRRFHTKEFRERERAFEHFAMAETWEKKHLSRLLRGR